MADYVEINPSTIKAIVEYLTGKDVEEALKELGVRDKDIELLLEEGKATGKLLLYLSEVLDVAIIRLLDRDAARSLNVLRSQTIEIPLRLRIMIDDSGQVTDVRCEIREE